LCEHGSDLIPVANIAPDYLHLFRAALPEKYISKFPGLFFTAAMVQNHGVTVFCKSHGSGAANIAQAAGYQDNFMSGIAHRLFSVASVVIV
jgi:hypothetical protein